MYRLRSAVLALAVASCRTNPTPPVVIDAGPTVVDAGPRSGRLEIAPPSTTLSIAILDDETFDAASAKASPAGAYLLESRQDGFRKDEGFRVLASPSRALVLKHTGTSARWVSPTEVAFLAADHVMKVDVVTKNETAGGVAGDRVLAWASADLAHALYIRRENVFDGTTGVFNGPFPRPLGVVDVAVSESGAACAVVVPRPLGGEPKPTSGTADLYCAEPAWAPPRLVRKLAVEDRLVDSVSAVLVRFFSEREVVVSLPASDVASSLHHCLVEIANGNMRCNDETRSEWVPLQDGRWVIEHAHLGPALLIDVTNGRSSKLGSAIGGYWSKPQADASDKKAITLVRLDKGRRKGGFGLVTLPEP